MRGVAATKISVTIDDTDLTWLRRRAKLAHGGNLSAAVAEAARALRQREALVAFLKEVGGPHLDPVELAAIQDEWRPPKRRTRKQRLT